MSIMTDLWLSGVFFSSSKYEHVFDRGSAPDPAGGAYDAPPYPLVSWGGAYPLENDRFEICHRCPMSDVAMAVSTDADTDADVAGLSHHSPK